MQYAMVADVPISKVAIESLDAHVAALRCGATLPIGSVEFVRKAMTIAGVAEPASMSYPECLHRWLNRVVERRSVDAVRGQLFVKPTTTKAFTGFVLDTRVDPSHLTCHDLEQYRAFLAMPPNAVVWICEPVTWLSEFRYYVVDGIVRGEGRYDDGPDEMPSPDIAVVREMVEVMSRSRNAPASFALDVGVLRSGQTALVECNDAWALGFYRGTLAHRDYIEMLWRRWDQLMRA